MKKYVSLFLVFALSVGALTACNSKKTFSGDGIRVMASSSWRQLITADDKKQMFDSDVEKPENIVLALRKSSEDGGYITVTKMENAMMMEKLDAFIAEAKKHVESKGMDKMLADYKEMGYTDREIDLTKPLLEGKDISTEDKVYLLQEVYLQEGLYSYAQDATTAYSLGGMEDLSINGQKVQAATYDNKNSAGSIIRNLEADIVVGGQMYVILAWAADSSFEKLKEEMKAIIVSMTFKESKGA